MTDWLRSLSTALRRALAALGTAPKAKAARKTAKRYVAPPREPGELIVQSLGVVLAVASAGFAVYMVSDDARQPQFAGLEHLSIFSKPSASGVRRAATQVAGDQRKQIDYTPVGSISESKREEQGGKFVLLSAKAGSAVIQTPTTILRISPGDLVEGLGRIAAIERRDDKWVVVTQSGSVVSN